MKKTALAVSILFVILLSSFKLGYPCHPGGDLGPCTHAMHALGDVGPCTHTYYDMWGNYCYQHPKGDLYPCTHPMHAGDIYPCSHVCY